jgi:hypothetical protein
MSTRRPFSVSSFAAHPPLTPEPMTIASNLSVAVMKNPSFWDKRDQRDCYCGSEKHWGPAEREPRLVHEDQTFFTFA